MKIDKTFSTAHILHGTPRGVGKGGLGELPGAPGRHWGPRAAAEAAGDWAAKDLQIGGRRADANPIPVYLNHQVSTPKGGRTAAIFYPLGHPTPYASGDCQYGKKPIWE
jgi:hypothetical protein